MKEFAVMGDYLKGRYNRATMVGMNQEATGLLTLVKSNRGVRKGDMVFMDASDNYCTHNPAVGTYSIEANIFIAYII